MAEIKTQKSKSYLVRHLDPKYKTHHYDPNVWHDKGHTITIITGHHERNDTYDLLFIDHVHIHRRNWQWIHKRTEVVWKQQQGEAYMSGHIKFRDDTRIGTGTMQIGREGTLDTVQLDYFHPSYSLAVSSNAGAYVAGEHELTLKWDPYSEEWRNATWDEDAMTFTYWLEEVGKFGDDIIWQTAIVFNDNHQDLRWDVQPRAPSGAGAATSQIDGSGQFLFSLNEGYNPPDVNYERNLFPYKMVFDFDEIAQNIVGGAMLCDERSLRGKVYAIKGSAQNHSVAGTYKLYRSNQVHTLLTTHRQKLVINGKHIANSGVSVDRLWWQGLSQSESTMANLPPSGFVEFSADGSVVTQSSFDAEGYRAHASPELESSLSIYDLLNMNPYQTTSDGVIDFIQKSAMEGFYEILLYYMPPKYLHDFIAANPPDLGDIEEIARDDPANADWYAKLAVPYLTNALKSSDRDSVKKLNARRAQAVMKEYTGKAKIYNNQTTQLYSHEWKKRFPIMSQFLYDQSLNTPHQRDYINQSTSQWIEEMQEGIAGTTDEDEKQDLHQMISIAENVHERGIQGQYWSYMLFRYLTSPQYLTMLRMIMTQGNTSSQQITQDIQRYASILSILDTSGFFMQQFTETMQIFQLSSLLPSFMDLANDWEEVSMFVPIITSAFVEKYINSTDPQMSKYAAEVNAELQKNSIKEYLKVLYDVGGTIGSSSWVNVSKAFTQKVVEKFGQAASKVGSLILIGSAASAIVQLSTGMISFGDMSPAQQANFIVTCLKVTTLFIRKGIQAAYAFQTGETLWTSFKVFFGKDAQLIATSTTSNFGRWIIRNSSSPPTSIAVDAEVAMRMAEGAFTQDFIFEVQYPRLCKVFGRNLNEFMATRFAAAMAIAGIVLSGLALGESHDSMTIAMNSLFLFSSLMNLVSVAAGWAITEGITAVGGFGLATMCSVASAFSIVAAIAGVVIMFVIMFTHKDPPNPVDEFVESNEVRDAGFYMTYESAVDYFQVISDENGQPRSIGVSLTPHGLDNWPCLTVVPNGYLTIGELSHGYDTVLSVSTDYQGYSLFSSRIFGEDDMARVVVLTLDENRQMMMKDPEVDEEKQNQQRWIVTCVGDVKLDSEGHLESASFVIENVGWRGFFLDVHGSTVVASNSKRGWTLKMQGMKPEMLTFPNIILSIYERDRVFYPCLGQVGSVSGQMWHVEPPLPDFLELDESKGLIRQKTGQKPPVYPTKSFAITVRNEHGSARAEFQITVQNV